MINSRNLNNIRNNSSSFLDAKKEKSLSIINIIKKALEAFIYIKV